MLKRLYHDYFKPDLLERYAMKVTGFSDCAVYMFATIRNCADVVFEMTFVEPSDMPAGADPNSIIPLPQVTSIDLHLAGEDNKGRLAHFNVRTVGRIQELSNTQSQQIRMLEKD